MKNLLFVDLDHTLTHAHWRDDLMDECARNKTWDDYHNMSAQDEPVLEMVELINTCAFAGWKVVALTTRPEKWRSMTNQWLIKHSIDIHILLMRPHDDYRSNAESKMAVYNEFLVGLEDKPSNIIIVDDHDGIVKAFKGINITVLQAHIRKLGYAHEGT
jgi:phosphoglycolate phosphatase-like HAD superfamily hydrolase